MTIILWILFGLGAVAIGAACGIALSEIVWRCWNHKDE